VPATDEAVALAVTAADAADDVKATDLTILDVADLLSLVDVFLLATASSDRQLKAMSERIEHRLREIDRKPLRREGTPASGWVLLDFGDLVCHLFSAEQRDFYSLERLWADVPRRDTSTGAPLPPGQRTGAPLGADPGADPGADLDADVGADRAVGGS
jgi:ribosome-associated protein